MRSEWRISRSTRLMILPLVVGMGAGAGTLHDRDVPEQEALRRIDYSEEDSARWMDTLRAILAFPCDSVRAPFANEVHDCQRFVMGPTEFGSLIGIYPDIGVIQQDQDFFESEPRVVAYITNAGGVIEPGDRYTDYGYGPLSIGRKDPSSGQTPGQSCLWLHSLGAGRWRAAIVPNLEHTLGEDLENRRLGCRTPPTEDEEWRRLRVTPQTHRDARPYQYPATARWMWTTPGRHGGQHYIVIKCGDMQCAIAPAGVTPPAINEAESDLRVALAGWHDAQFLAVGARGRLTPGPWAEIHPLLAPGIHQTTPPIGSDWEIVARYVVHSYSAPYVEKWGLGMDQGGRWSADVWLQVTPGASGATSSFQKPDDGTYSAPKVVLVSEKIHGPHGSARWRWRPDDEGGWVPCREFGCCDPDAGG